MKATIYNSAPLAGECLATKKGITAALSQRLATLWMLNLISKLAARPLTKNVMAVVCACRAMPSCQTSHVSSAQSQMLIATYAVMTGRFLAALNASKGTGWTKKTWSAKNASELTSTSALSIVRLEQRPSKLVLKGIIWVGMDQSALRGALMVNSFQSLNSNRFLKHCPRSSASNATLHAARVSRMTSQKVALAVISDTI